MQPMLNRNAIRQSDAEITRPHNDLIDDAAAPAWHVHLELRPEELVVLHRLGFTGSALAWREGMREWQPLRVGGESGLTERESLGLAGEQSELVADVEAPRRPMIFSHGPHTAPPLAQPMAVPLVKVRPTPEILPPPPPVEPRIPFAEPLEPQSGAMPRYALTDVELSPPLMGDMLQELKPSSIPPGVALDSLPRPALRSTGSKALWLGAAALVALSASNGALVSALLWSLRNDARPSAMAAKLTAAAKDTQDSTACPIPSAAAAKAENTAAAAAPAETAAAPLGAQPVSVDQLPLAGSPAAARATEPESSEASSGRRARGHRAAAAPRKSAAAAPTEEAAPRHVDSAVAPAELASSGPPDRKAISQAVSRAASAATSCADGPQSGRVTLIFAPSGNVQSVQLVQGFGESSINSCVLRAMGRAHVRSFSGDVVTVQKTISW